MLIEELLNRSRLEKLLRDSYGNYCVQTALDYAEPMQRTLLVEGIRPVLPLIRNTPYGKRIQNKLLQREQVDQFGTFHNQQALVSMALTNQGMGLPQGRCHLSPSLQGNPLANVYSAQNSLYSLQQAQALYGQAPLTFQLHTLQSQSIDGYVLQNSNHSQGVSPSHGNGFSTVSFAGVNHFGGSALHSTINDPYQRSAFGYGM